ncbi:MAG: TolC family protein [Syntrophotaleaceae bacterium]
MLRRRPDIRRVERQLAAQTARIGIATADLYPRLSLSGSFALEALDSGELFKSSSRAFSFGPALRWLLFDGNRVRSRIAAEEALAEQAFYRYEQTVLTAVSEAENALTEYLQQRNRQLALERSQTAARRTVQLSTGLYKDGLSDFQNVLDAQRALFEIENQLAAARGDAVINLVQLYKALGGGWNPPE